MAEKQLRAYQQKAGMRAETTGEGEAKKKVIRGYPIIFNTPAKIPYVVDGKLEWWEEVVEKGALDGVDLSDLQFYQEHLPQLIMAKNGINMRVAVDEVGLFVEITLPDTILADHLYELIRLEILTDMSYWFLADVITDYRNKKDTIKKFLKVIEVSAVARGAYKEAIVMAYEPDDETAGGSRSVKFLI